MDTREWTIDELKQFARDNYPQYDLLRQDKESALQWWHPVHGWALPYFQSERDALVYLVEGAER